MNGWSKYKGLPSPYVGETKSHKPTMARSGRTQTTEVVYSETPSPELETRFQPKDYVVFPKISQYG